MWHKIDYFDPISPHFLQGEKRGGDRKPKSWRSAATYRKPKTNVWSIGVL